MKKIYIKENKISLLKESEDKEVTFYEFFINAKEFLKKLLENPSKADIGKLFTTNGISKNELLSKMKDIGLIKSTEKITEVPVEEAKTHPYGKKMIAKRFIQYKIPKSRFKEKMHELYKELFEETKSVFSDENQIIDDILNMDDNNDYKERGGYKKVVEEDGATSCGGVMQGGGTNPDAGQFITPISPVQRRGFWSASLKRNKDEKNGSISMNRKK